MTRDKRRLRSDHGHGVNRKSAASALPFPAPSGLLRVLNVGMACATVLMAAFIVTAFFSGTVNSARGARLTTAIEKSRRLDELRNVLAEQQSGSATPVWDVANCLGEAE